MFSTDPAGRGPKAPLMTWTRTRPLPEMRRSRGYDCSDLPEADLGPRPVIEAREEAESFGIVPVRECPRSELLSSRPLGYPRRRQQDREQLVPCVPRRVAPTVNASSGRRLASGRQRPPTSRSFVINLAVGDVMSRRPITIGAEATLLDALVLMRGQKITGLPVLDDAGTVVGVLSERDVARALAMKGSLPEATGLFDLLIFGVSTERSQDLVDFHRVLEETHVRDSMSTPPITISWDASLELAADLMRKNEINRIPVLKGGRLVGIITRDDLVRALVHS